MYASSDAAPDAAFNSISDNPKHGDERNFTLCRRADYGDNFRDTVAMSDGQLLEVYVYLDNAATRPDASIVDARMQVLTDTTAVDDPRLQVRFSGTRSSDGQPLEAWDGCGVNSDKPVRLVLVPSSGQLIIGNGDHITVSDEILMGKAVLPGTDDHLPGVVPGSQISYGYFLFRMLAVSG